MPPISVHQLNPKPITTSATGVQNNVIEVKESDFDVLTALSYDMASSRSGATPEDNPNGTGNTPGTPQRGESTGHENVITSEADTAFLSGGGGGSPPGDYGRVIPASPQAAMHLQTGNASGVSPSTNSHLHSSGDSKKPPAPPLLPPQLLQITAYMHTDLILRQIGEVKSAHPHRLETFRTLLTL
ncbi:unnamed protein product [Echinostoma caproni]|uniref:Hormone receptor 4 n=1 Tax=Echinostoma caproni TaxID=27848 RepID=A0A183AU57_9TREM|nr:unnamed protein product [Echinostoma caproni]